MSKSFCIKKRDERRRETCEDPDGPCGRKPIEIPLVSTTKEVAILLKMSESWVKNNLQNGNLKGFKTGTIWKVYKDDLLKFMGQGA